ncbi:MAG: hypothetical protein JXX28_04895 [Deltaproteobacteria bacterium]|nr:hypothetical protein [Deltaproteobacteria bacterium]
MPTDRYDQKKKGPSPQVEAQDLEQEEQAPQHEAAELAQQNQLGNQAIAAQLAQEGMGGMDVGVELMGPVRREEKEGPQYGGDGDAGDDGQLTLDDLVRSWNPSGRHGEDHARFMEAMPDDTLPPEDAAFLGQVRESPAALPPAERWFPDSMLQPSAVVVAASLTRWSEGVRAWAGPSLLQRALSQALASPIPTLQDPWGRVLIGRARGACLGLWLLTGASRAVQPTSAATAGLMSFHLELLGRAHTLKNLDLAFEQSEEKLPQAGALYERWHRSRGGKVLLRELPEAAAEQLRTALRLLLDLPDAHALLPPAPGADPAGGLDDDPLGLDAILAQFTATGGDRETLAYQGAVQAAERMAHAAARTRVQLASVAVLLSRVSAAWSAGDPQATLLQILGLLDKDVQSMLRLLVEVARAAQARTVDLAGVRNGLTRAARALQKAQSKGTELLLRVVGGVLPGEPTLSPALALPEDPLSLAWAAGSPADAIPWLRARASSPEDLLALLLTRSAVAGPGDLAEDLWSAWRALPAALRPVAGLLLGANLLWMGDTAGAREIASAQRHTALQRRSGALLAEAALLEMEALRLEGREEALIAARLQAGRELWTLGAAGGLSLLARWAPPEDDA